MKQILKQLHLYFYHLMVLLFYFLLYPWLYGYSRNQRSYHKLNKIRQWNAKLACFFSGIRYTYHFKEKIDWSKTYIVCANHSSNMDILAMTMLMKNNFFFMGKDELLNNPLTALYFKTIDVPVNRQSKISSYRAFKTAGERLKEGMSLMIFPEGKIGDEYPPLLHPFKNGPFKLAISLKIPILPVSIVNNWELLWDDGKRYGSKPGKCNIMIHEPVYTENLSEKDEENLKNNVFEIVHSALNYKIYKDS
nr:lysophospholipid acyltransferase family protein [Pedobacter glucosidilyticus]